ncbi:MAG: hypothetical protein J5809_01375 [Selenomonadaceae bacterium]|nr:hypothetical protein [Selenomonadaceae bacterium]
MDFTRIGTIGSFIRQKNLTFAANYKIKTGQRIVSANGTLNFTTSSMFSQVASANKKTVSAVDKARLATIKRKLMSGKKLSESEMNYLREKDPKTYKKAKYADDAREELKAELKSAKTKQEARQAVMHAMAKVASEASAELSSLQNGGAAGGGFNAGGGMDFSGGDFSGEVPAIDSPDISADAEISVDANAEIAADFQAATGEISEAANENFSAENSTAQNDGGEDSSSPLDIIDKFIMAIRALQDEWAQFSKSDEYQELPEDFSEGGVKLKIFVPNFKAADAVLAYREAMAAGSAV